MGTIAVKRVYEPPAEGDGVRILVDRLWPRGLSKERAKVDLWLKDIAPSPDLRRRYCQPRGGWAPDKWDEFKQAYFAELEEKQELVSEILKHASSSCVTLLFAAKSEGLNNAVALKEYLEGRGGAGQEEGG
ncbi:MAG: hypothetical protein XD60_0600 [Acetothermia bacterium 64_32]|nr:MAG: hypothetical protein XD60_0600 [Acetothermia bacterium 64_32]MBC7098131.1 DUF488 family protein [Candidatus Bipolaricaulota bacterium]HAF71227.1 hypothetical protein [Candidatus Acetothermia bacterium]